MAVSQEIMQSIQTGQQNGQSIGTIREQLIGKGIPVADIDAAIQSLSPASATPAVAATQPLPSPADAVANHSKGMHLPLWLVIVIGAFFAIGYAYMWYVILFKTFSLPGLSS